MLEYLISALLAVTVQYTIYEPIDQQDRQTSEVSEGDAEQDNQQERDLSNDTNGGEIVSGFVSSYSATYGGCLDCKQYFDENGQLYYNTFSGERLDDSLFTLASNDFAMHTMVSVCNTRNSKCVASKVNDTGGFNSLGRIADLSVAAMNAIEAITDVDIITIEPI